jgi:transcriptional regulator with XRE-family HTH domain
MGEVGRRRLGGRIRALRQAKGWTQEDLAEKSGLHPTYIGGIERGERNVGLDNLLKIATAFRVHPSALFEDFPR